MVIEQTKWGLQLFNNPIGVLSNSPDFGWHMTNLRNYMNVTPRQNTHADWENITLTPLGQGAGTTGLPGDYTPPSRFVKTAFQKSHTLIPADREEAAVTCFHILEGVSIPKGVVVTQQGSYDYTQYTSFMNTAAGDYYYKTYDNSQIVNISLPRHLLYGQKPVSLKRLLSV